jgi:hypothetical protein
MAEHGMHHGHAPPAPYNDHILTITGQSCPDPYVICDKGVYYMVCFLGMVVVTGWKEKGEDLGSRCMSVTLLN